MPHSPFVTRPIMSSILFIKTSSLGDVIHHMPAVIDARRWHRDAHIAWVVEEAFAPLIRLHPAVDEVIAVAQRRWRSAAFAPRTWRETAAFVAGLRKRDYDCIIDTQGLFFKSAILARLASGTRHGYDASSIRDRAASLLYDVKHRIGRDLHAIVRNRWLTGAALGYTPAADVDFGIERQKLASPKVRTASCCTQLRALTKNGRKHHGLRLAGRWRTAAMRCVSRGAPRPSWLAAWKSPRRFGCPQFRTGKRSMTSRV